MSTFSLYVLRSLMNTGLLRSLMITRVNFGLEVWILGSLKQTMRHNERDS